jgi:hypothetical protein
MTDTHDDPEDPPLPTLQDEYENVCLQFFDTLTVFDYITPGVVNSMKEYVKDPLSAEETSRILFPFNKNIIDCCKKQKSSYMFLNDVLLFKCLDMKLFLNESKKTKKNIVKHLSNILTKSIPLVTDQSIFLTVDIPPELSKLVNSITENLGTSDLSQIDPMKLLFSGGSNGGLLDTLKDQFKNVDHKKVLQEVMGLMQNPDFLSSMASTLSQTNLMGNP